MFKELIQGVFVDENKKIYPADNADNSYIGTFGLC